MGKLIQFYFTHPYRIAKSLTCHIWEGCREGDTPSLAMNQKQGTIQLRSQ